MFASDVNCISLYLNDFVGSLYYNEYPVSSSMTVPIKKVVYANLLMCRSTLTPLSHVVISLLFVISSGVIFFGYHKCNAMFVIVFIMS